MPLWFAEITMFWKKTGGNLMWQKWVYVLLLGNMAIQDFPNHYIKVRWIPVIVLAPLCAAMIYLFRQWTMAVQVTVLRIMTHYNKPDRSLRTLHQSRLQKCIAVPLVGVSYSAWAQWVLQCVCENCMEGLVAHCLAAKNDTCCHKSRQRENWSVLDVNGQVWNLQAPQGIHPSSTMKWILWHSEMGAFWQLYSCERDDISHPIKVIVSTLNGKHKVR